MLPPSSITESIAENNRNRISSSMPENTHQRHDPLLLPSLKCPRCDSSNTKFCYYNNYSLSQPRHFCKACKRYWTRGGTLRNVPVGGGCRKNKRVRRQRTPAATAATETTAHHNISPSQNYSLSTNPIRHNFPLSTFNSARAFSSDNNNNNRGSDLEHQMNGFGIGGSDEFLHDAYKIGFMADSASSFFSPPGYNNNYHSLCFGSSSPFSNSTTVMATLLASGIPQQKLFDTDEIGSVQHANHHPPDPDPDPDPSLLWFDPTSITGSSVPSLI